MFRRSPSRSRSESRSPSRSRSRSRSPCRSLSGSRSRSRSRSRSGRESETLTHRGAGASTMISSESRAAIEREFRELKRRQAKLMKKKKDIAKKVDKLGDKIERMIDVMEEFERADSLPTALIHFVHQLEKANLYFQFKERAKQRHNFEHCVSPIKIAAMLFRDVELMSDKDFYNIENSDIYNAATAIYWEPICKQTQTSPNEPALMDWIYRRVYRVLQGDYVMDKDPEVELKKMMESEPDEYDSYFLLKPANYKKMSKQEAYKKYSELVNIINTGARDSEAFDQNHKVPSTAISSRNKEAVYAKHMVPSTVSGARNKEALHVEVPRKRKRDKASNKDLVVLPLQGVC